jgi:hypothetical protein
MADKGAFRLRPQGFDRDALSAANKRHNPICSQCDKNTQTITILSPRFQIGVQGIGVEVIFVPNLA